MDEHWSAGATPADAQVPPRAVAPAPADAAAAQKLRGAAADTRPRPLSRAQNIKLNQKANKTLFEQQDKKRRETVRSLLASQACS